MNAPTYPFPERDPLTPIVPAYVRPVDLPLPVQIDGVVELKTLPSDSVVVVKQGVVS